MAAASLNNSDKQNVCPVSDISLRYMGLKISQLIKLEGIWKVLIMTCDSPWAVT